MGKSKLTRLGKFRIGDKQGDRPIPLRHFRITEYAEPVLALYGEKPEHVTISLPENLTPEVWDSAYYRYTRNGEWACKGDGQVGQERQPSGGYKPRECANRGCPFAIGQDGKVAACRPIATLSFKVEGVPTVGVYTADFRGLAAIESAHSYLMGLQALYGDVTHVPFVLYVSEIRSPKGHRNPIMRLKDAPQTAYKEAEPSYTSLLNLALAEPMIYGKQRKRLEEELQRADQLDPATALERRQKLKNLLHELQSTAEQPAAQFAFDAELEQHLLERVPEPAFTALGLIKPKISGLTRRQVRLLAASIQTPA